MYGNPETKKCPKCRGTMVKLTLDSSLAERWKCTNQNCNYEERKEYFDMMTERNNGGR